MKDLYIIVQKDLKPVMAVDGGIVAFLKKKEALEWLREMKTRGDQHIYGRDTWSAWDLRIVRGIIGTKVV